jgi:uncharacterized protein YfaS (alpha-2-macroglobulin family)
MVKALSSLFGVKGSELVTTDSSYGGVQGEHPLIYVTTDRPIYRPGHTVHFKGVLRVRNPEGYAVPVGKTVSIEIHDPEQKPVYQKAFTVSATGGSPGVSDT